MTPDEYCQQKAAQSGSSFYYSFLFLPEDRRRAITALYAFCREVDDVVDETADAGVARTKLVSGATRSSAYTKAGRSIPLRARSPKSSSRTGFRNRSFSK